MSLPFDSQPHPLERVNRLRVLVVDDSVPQRMMLVALMEADPELEVVGWAANGAQAVRAAVMLKPDVITMDLRMPQLDGLEATRRIMQEAPTPIVLVTASASRENQKLAFEAFGAGVLAVVEKPTAGAEGRHLAAELLRTVKSMARVKVIRRWSGRKLPIEGGSRAQRLAGSGVSPESQSLLHTCPLPIRAKAPMGKPEVVAIGASTGGPQALQEILSCLPATFHLPVLVVQHIAEGFTSGLVEWLKPSCAPPIDAVSSDLVALGPGIHVAPSGKHMVLRGRLLTLVSDPPVSGHRPSATVLFQSMARSLGASAVGVLLTGMGDDGAAGLRDIKRAGGVTVAQDEESSVVFGMPAVAIGMGVVDHVLAPPSIGRLLATLWRPEP